MGLRGVYWAWCLSFICLSSANILRLFAHLWIEVCFWSILCDYENKWQVPSGRREEDCAFKWWYPIDTLGAACPCLSKVSDTRDTRLVSALDPCTRCFLPSRREDCGRMSDHSGMVGVCVCLIIPVGAPMSDPQSWPWAPLPSVQSGHTLVFPVLCNSGILACGLLLHPVFCFWLLNSDLKTSWNIWVVPRVLLQYKVGEGGYKVNHPKNCFGTISKNLKTKQNS